MNWVGCGFVIPELGLVQFCILLKGFYLVAVDVSDMLSCEIM